ncbi:Deoxyribonuclease II like protein, partial [Aduncisulcus paluster]
MKVIPIILMCLCIICIPGIISNLGYVSTVKIIKNRKPTEKTIGCLDENGKSIDWFIAMKAPMLQDHSEEYVQDGFGYTYLDVSSKQFKFSPYSLQDSNGGALILTLSQIYGLSDYDETVVIMYNDEHDDGTSDSYKAHAKGVIAFDVSSGTGFWLVHSVPSFPHSPFTEDTYQYPDDEAIYGQSFLCMDVNADILNDTVSQYLYDIYPSYYVKNLPTVGEQTLSEFYSIVSKVSHTTKSTAELLPFSSRGGYNFLIFAKNRQWDGQLYDDFVSQYFLSNMMTETWMRPEYPPMCSNNSTVTYTIANVMDVDFGDDLTWHYTKDHSKWAMKDERNDTFESRGLYTASGAEFV